MKETGRHQERLITSTSGRGLGHLKEVWDYRELFGFLVWRDILIRYKQAVLGVTWAIFQPLLTMVVFGLVFNRLLGVPAGEGPYALFVFAGLLPWQLFSASVGRSSGSLVGNANLLTKVYFPRIIVPLANVLTGIVDLMLGLVVFVVMMVAYQTVPGWQVLWLPVFILLTVAFAAALGLWFSALNVMYRDVQYIVPFFIQLMMFVSPVAYSASVVPSGAWAVVYGLNPLAGAIQGFRWCLLDGPQPGTLTIVSAGVVLVLLASGLWYFGWVERHFADVV